MNNNERYATAGQNDIEKLMQNSRAKNTVKQTKKWVCAYEEWATLRDKEIDLLSLSPTELDSHLQYFFAEVRKKNDRMGVNMSLIL